MAIRASALLDGRVVLWTLLAIAGCAEGAKGPGGMDGATPLGDASVLLDANLEPALDGALPADGAVVVRDGSAPQPDGDGDGVPDRSDNCPMVANAPQADVDGDSAGDVCDNCVPIANIDQADTNQNGIGDVCESAVFRDGDQDGDGVANADDTCLFVADATNVDADVDGFGDACDNCPALANGDQADLNNDGTGDACADGRGAVVDSDGDGLQDANDNCPQVASADTADRDNDLIGDACDNCPNVANYKQVDSDMNGVGDLCEPLFNDPTQDGDGDGVPNGVDNCLQLANPDQLDQDRDQVGDACDNCKAVANADQRPVSDPAKCMYNPAQDTDADGIPDQDDNCPTLANANQADQDMDRRGDVCDNCVGRANYSQVDSDSDNIGDVCEQLPDRDSDGVPDAVDNCIGTANVEQVDADGDNVGNACDNCSSMSNSGQQDSDRDRMGDHCDDNALPPANTCAEGTTQANPVKPNLYFLLDRSLSMVLEMDTPTRLGSLTNALDMLFGSDAMPGSVVSNFNVGMGVFPGAGDPNTTEGSCMAGALPVSLLTMESYPASTLRDAYAGLTANGLTPTDVALARVRERELYNLANDPLPAARAKAVVLITDGEPNNCTISGFSAPTNRVGETVAQARKLAAAGVPVYVLGFTGVNPDVMEAIAYAGSRTQGASLPTVSCSERYCSAIGSNFGCSGAGPAPGCICDDDPADGRDGYSPSGCVNYPSLNGVWYPVSNAQSIVGALNEIITRTVSCTLPLTPTPGRTVDPAIARVRFVNGAANTLLAPATDYTLSGTSVTLVGAACANLQNAVISNPDARVDVDLGCACVAGAAEICFDGVDNDCDGRVDEDCIPTDVCGVDAPVENCRTPEEDTPEVCEDGVDNDKDGDVDEGCPMTCESPTAEYCDRVDNDCDGQTDEDCPPACVPAPEICNGKDDDCNQLVDEGCDMTCRPFTEICNGLDDDCDGMVDEGCLECPERGDEICDGKDNDCDGLIDEGCPSGPLFL